MKAAIVLLAGRETQNFCRRVLLKLAIQQPIEFFAALLPAHVSLKQPFSFEDLDALDRYTTALAARIAPFEIYLDRFYSNEWEGFGILGLNVVETSRLRELHDLLNRELPRVVQDANAPHDGSGYHFHLTIEMGKVAGGNPFRQYFDSLPSPVVDMHFEARELGVFFYADERHRPGSFIHYMTLPLTGTPPRMTAA